MTEFIVNFPSDLSDNQSIAIDATLNALKEFVVAPNDVATDKNNALQKSAGEARKAMLNIQPKAKKETK